MNSNTRRIVDLSGRGWTFDDKSISVPHTWNAIDAADGKGPPPIPTGAVGTTGYSRGAHTYARDLPDPTPGRRNFIRCDGVSIKAEVFVNGKRVGMHAGAFTAFTFEITTVLKPSGNKLEIVADNSYDRNIAPISGDFSMFGGIYRKVELIETAQRCISPIEHGGDGVIIDADPDTGHVTAKAHILNAEIGMRDAECEEWIVKEFDFGEVELWSPENPKLYEVTIDIGTDAITRKIGFRKVEFREDGFYLNGVKRQIRGVCRHQDRDGKGWAVSIDDEAEDIAWIKSMGADGVRTSHYPQSQTFFDMCDEKGLLVWTELPNVEELEFSPSYRANILEMTRETVAQLRNHPSVIAWGVYNEIFGAGGGNMDENKVQDLLGAVNDEFHRLDPSRRTISSQFLADSTRLNALTDLQGWNTYPGWYFGQTGSAGMVDSVNEFFAKNPSRKVAAMSEYGAGGTIGQHNDPLWRPVPNETEYPEEYQAYYHYQAYLALRDDPRIFGTFLWNMFDLAADDRREADRHGINNKGLITGDRKTPKDAFYFYKANWNKAPLLHLVGKRMMETPRSSVNILVFSNVGEVTLSVNGKVVGTMQPDTVNTCLWRDVSLEFGENQIEISAGILRETATWTRKAPFSSLRVWWPDIEQSWEKAWPVIKRNRGVFDEIWFSGGVIEPLERHAERAKWMAEAASEAREAGYVSSIEFELTIGNSDPCDGNKPAFRNWQGFVGPEGRVGVRCNCPRDPAFHEYFRQVLKRYLVFQPDYVWLDDDVRVFNHGGNSWGCFCDRCVGEFSQKENKVWTRETLVKAMETDPGLKARYIDHCYRGLAEFAFAFAKAVKEFSPKSILGLQYPWDDDGQLHIVDALVKASGEKIAIRPGSCDYTDRDPFDQIRKTWRLSRQVKVLKTLPDAYLRWCPEIETYPRNFTMRTPRGLCLEPLYHLSQDMIDTLSWYPMSEEEEPEWYDNTVLAGLRRNVWIYKAYAKAKRGACPCGFGCVDFKVGTRLSFPIPVEMAATGIPFSFGDGVSLGVILTDCPELSATSDEALKKILAGPVLADRASVTRLVERGLLDDETLQLMTEERTDSAFRHPKIIETQYGGRMAIFDDWWPYGKSSKGLLEYSHLADEACGGKLPLLLEDPAMAVLMPQVLPDGTFAAAAIVNARIDVQPAFRVRIRKFRGDKPMWYALDSDSPVELNVVRDESTDDAIVTIPAIAAWSGGFIR